MTCIGFQQPPAAGVDAAWLLPLLLAVWVALSTLSGTTVAKSMGSGISAGIGAIGVLGRVFGTTSEALSEDGGMVFLFVTPI
jgi:uncharacterized protein (DUF697 family)